MFEPGEVIGYIEMCLEEGMQLQRGMNFRGAPSHSVVLMSRRKDAVYADEILDEGRTIIYEGHDVPRSHGDPDPKSVDQEARTPRGRPTQNGLFASACEAFKNGERAAPLIRAYEKLHQGIWVYNGEFRLTDTWRQASGQRQVFKFRLEMNEGPRSGAERVPTDQDASDLPNVRVIPSDVKLEVWQRDEGRCTKCGSADQLHFDHVIPFSRGGSSLTSSNVQLLCARHNLSKGARIE